MASAHRLASSSSTPPLFAGPGTGTRPHPLTHGESREFRDVQSLTQLPDDRTRPACAELCAEPRWPTGRMLQHLPLCLPPCACAFFVAAHEDLMVS